MERAGERTRDIRFYSAKNNEIVCLHSKWARDYARWLETQPWVSQFPVGLRHHSPHITGGHTGGLPASCMDYRFSAPVRGRPQRCTGTHSCAVSISFLATGSAHAIHPVLARCSLFARLMRFTKPLKHMCRRLSCKRPPSASQPCKLSVLSLAKQTAGRSQSARLTETKLRQTSSQKGDD